MDRCFIVRPFTASAGGACKILTQDLEYDELFMGTSIMGEMLLREGWSEQGEVDFLNGERGRVYVRSLTKRRKA